MPCLEETPKNYSEMINDTNPTAPVVANNNVPDSEISSLEEKQDDEQEEVVVRELTQTDRLNNRLLKSLLDHMNAGGANKFVADTYHNNVSDN